MSIRNGKPSANQFIIYTPEGAAFQSYTTVIAFRDHRGNVTLDKNKWNYSTTTSKYRNEFLREKTKETESKIKSGEYHIADLNGKPANIF